LYSRYTHRIGAYVRGMVRDHGRAEDITQEIFISALRRMRETERPIAFKPWIYEIAKNACIDSFRRTRRAQEVSLDADDGLSSADRGRLTVVTTPDAALDSKQAIHDLRRAFGGLSENHHEILVLRELEGRSYSDIGERLGMSRPVVESTLFRARRRLAEEYDELTSGRRCEAVRKLVDSGPHYSLGIRDRRRMARHFAHCQSCRAHARIAGFDESILSMPNVAAKIAAMLPIPMLRARWGSVGHLGANRDRRSLLAWRSMHTLAGSSDQIVGMGSGAGRGVATAAALVLAGVGGAIATVTSSAPVKASHGGAVHAAAYRPQGPAALRAGRLAPRAARNAKRPAGSRTTSATSPHAVVSRGIRSGSGTAVPAGFTGGGHGASTVRLPVTSAPTSTAGPARPGGTASMPGAGALPAAPGMGVAGDPTSAGGLPVATPTIPVPVPVPPLTPSAPTGGSLPTGTPSTPSTPSTGLSGGTLGGGVGGVTGGKPELPKLPGGVGGSPPGLGGTGGLGLGLGKNAGGS
jgi:RNA polymerase sigma factor (sigma-70 family)